MTIGNRVIALLEEKDLKQKDLAAYLGTSPSTVNGWKGAGRNPSIDLLAPICEFLGVPADYLLTGEEKRIASLAPNDKEWLLLVHQLPAEAQLEFRGEIKGYLKCLHKKSSTNNGKPQDTS